MEHVQTTDNEITIRFAGKAVKIVLDDTSDHIQRQIACSMNFYEQDLLEELFHRAMPEMQFIDVGANIGNHTLFLSGIAGMRGYAFEPFLPNYNRLIKNISHNSLYDKVTTMNVAVGAEEGTANQSLSSSTNTGQVSYTKSESGIKMISLDSMNIERVDFLKIDVEGYEVAVIAGAKEMIRLHRPLIICEASTPRDYKEVCDTLAPLKYLPTRRYCVTPTYLFEHQ